MVRFSWSLVSDIAFWTAIILTAPLMLVYFLLLFVYRSVANFVRIWNAPKPATVHVPLDPVNIDGTGVWPTDTAKPSARSLSESQLERREPTVREVLEVKSMLARMRFTKLWSAKEAAVVQASATKKARSISSYNNNNNQLPSPASSTVIGKATQTPQLRVVKLPPEIVDYILDLAAYWPKTKTVVSRVMLVGAPHTRYRASVWMNKERDYKHSTPGASKRRQPWERTPSTAIHRALDGEDSNYEHGVYLRSFPIGASIDLKLPSELVKPDLPAKPQKAVIKEFESRIPGVRRLWDRKSADLEAVDLEKGSPRTGVAPVTGVLTASAPLQTDDMSNYLSRPLYPNEVNSWMVEIAELYPNTRPDLTLETLERKIKRGHKREWRRLYVSGHLQRSILGIYRMYTTIIQEKLNTESIQPPTNTKPFELRKQLVPQLVDFMGDTRNIGRDKIKSGLRTASVRKLVWTIWSKEYAEIEFRAGFHSPSAANLTWYEMFIEEPIAHPTNPNEITWRKKFPPGKENVLVQRDLSHRNARGVLDNALRVHRVTWSYDDWETTKEEDLTMDTPLDHWQYAGQMLPPDDFGVLNPGGGGTAHPYVHGGGAGWCDCPYGRQLWWGDAVPRSSVSPVQECHRRRPVVPAANTDAVSEVLTFASSSSSSSSSSEESYASEMGMSPVINPAFFQTFSVDPKNVPPNKVLEEDARTGALRRNGAVARLVRELKMGDRVCLVVRSGGGVGWSPALASTNWGEVAVFRGEVEVFWAV